MTDARWCAAQALVEGGYLLAEDAELVVGQAPQRYELLLSCAQEPILAGEGLGKGGDVYWHVPTVIRRRQR